MDLEISKGDIVGLLGPNGAGKTTLIKCLCGLIAQDEGDIFIDKIRLEEKNLREHLKNIGAVLEGARNLYWNLTVLDNAYYLGALKGKDKKYIDEFIEKYRDSFGLSELLDRKINSLSLGQKQKVAIIISLIHRPKIIILDEPSNGLDIDSKTDLISILKDIKEEFNSTMLITSHDVDFIRRVVDKFIIINKGKKQDQFENDNLNVEDIEKIYKGFVN
ncbi:ABC transporter ATP-binding protein [Hathewaya histolytica]|uniref:ABC transporter n=1 Tax=Hathewaya histolytica TaxID=1498 RepID=A0A4U9QU20_HATHI|nr:ABC transporter ATP-binding protein [Hathewaya histolytica]VTQ82164.1 ABC transporter [Hathewaya histolytica]